MCKQLIFDCTFKKRKKASCIPASKRHNCSVKDYPIFGLLHDKLPENCQTVPTFNHKFVNDFTIQNNYINTTQNAIDFTRISVTVILG